MRDLFGNERIQTSNGKGVSLSLFDAAAERNAMKSGRPVSQEKNEILVPVTWSPPVCPKHGSPLLLEAGGQRKYSCPRCSA